MRRLVVAAAAGLIVGACGSPSPQAPTSGSSSDLLQTTGLVLHEKGKEPILCMGGVSDSLPPQCGGLTLAGWDWEAVAGEEGEPGATRWGEFHVVGRLEDDVFTVEEAGAPEETPPPDTSDEARYVPPCPEPEGGWVAHDPSKTGHEDLGNAARIINTHPQTAGSWVHYINGRPTDEEMEELAMAEEFEQPPVVLTGAFKTGTELGPIEADIRRVWGGALCLVEKERSERDLGQIRKEFGEEFAPSIGLDITWSDLDVVEGTINFGLVSLTGEQRAAVTERYGDLVNLYPQLRPVEDQ